jgi:hypothetical protein
LIVEARYVPLPAFHRTEGVDFLAHAREEGARHTRCAGFGAALVGVVHLEGDLVQLRHGVAADFARRTVVVGHTLGTLLQAATNADGSVVYLPNNEDRTDNTRRETL